MLDTEAGEEVRVPDRQAQRHPRRVPVVSHVVREGVVQNESLAEIAKNKCQLLQRLAVIRVWAANSSCSTCQVQRERTVKASRRVFPQTV